MCVYTAEDNRFLSLFLNNNNKTLTETRDRKMTADYKLQPDADFSFHSFTHLNNSVTSCWLKKQKRSRQMYIKKMKILLVYIFDNCWWSMTRQLNNTTPNEWDRPTATDRRRWVGEWVSYDRMCVRWVLSARLPCPSVCLRWWSLFHNNLL